MNFPIAIESSIERSCITLSARVLLRLHVEAVWGVRLPAIDRNEMTLLPESATLAWKLCAAEIAEGQVYIWRPDVADEERVLFFKKSRA